MLQWSTQSNYLQHEKAPHTQWPHRTVTEQKQNTVYYPKLQYLGMYCPLCICVTVPQLELSLYWYDLLHCLWFSCTLTGRSSTDNGIIVMIQFHLKLICLQNCYTNQFYILILMCIINYHSTICLYYILAHFTKQYSQVLKTVVSFCNRLFAQLQLIYGLHLSQLEKTSGLRLEDHNSLLHTEDTAIYTGTTNNGITV